MSDLSRNDLLKWCYHLGGLDYQVISHDGLRDVEYVFRTADLDAATMDCFGRTWDYSIFDEYDAAAGTVSVRKTGNIFNDDELIWDEYTGHERVDDTQYDIYLGRSTVLRVQRVDNNFVFVHFRLI